ncbi:hypothetical protein [Acanthamoeba castellanii mamavirus]|nr:hypothetical protein [Acanthamoeba castellanii mamavirus]
MIIFVYTIAIILINKLIDQCSIQTSLNESSVLR